MSMTKTTALAAALVATLLAVGCANQKAPATKAVADAEATLASERNGPQPPCAPAWRDLGMDVQHAR